MSIDVVRVEIRGRWEGQPHARFVGRALNSWLYGELARIDPDCTTALHEMTGQKPLAIALAEPGNLLVFSGYGPLVDPILRIAEHMPERLLLDAHWWLPEAEPVVRADEWAVLARPLLSAPAPAIARFSFLSPTTFHARGQFLPLPVPELVLASLLDRWQRWSHIDLGPGAAETLATAAVLRKFRGATVPVQTAGFQPGFLGAAEFGLRRPAPEYAGLLAVLAAFAPYAGVGAKVGQGMGCVDTSILPGRLRPSA